MVSVGIYAQFYLSGTVTPFSAFPPNYQEQDWRRYDRNRSFGSLTAIPIRNTL